MGNRKILFAPGEFYHIYNRGVDKRIIFENVLDIDRFFQSLVLFNTVDPIGSIYESSFLKETLGSSTSKLVHIIAYCLNPNHYHLLVEQVADGGIQKFMHRLATGYTNYFNEQHSRSGSLFQGRYKAVHVSDNEYLLHLSAYVNLNNRVHELGSPTSTLVRSRSSWEEYVNGVRGFCTKAIILDQFKGVQEYSDFAVQSVKETVERRKEDKALQLMLME